MSRPEARGHVPEPRSTQRRSFDASSEVALQDGTAPATDRVASRAAPAASAPYRFRIGRVSCTTHTRAQLLDEVQRMLASPPGSGRIINCLNPHIYNLAKNDPELLAWIAEARVTGADGLGIVWAARILGIDLVERCDMIDSFKAFLADGRFRASRALLLGGYEGHAELAAPRIEASSSHCRIVRTVDGFQADERYAEILRATKDVDFVLVGMGTPKSERIASMAARIRPEAIVWHIGGGTIEIFAGKTEEPPEWIKRRGLQWLHRFVRHPRRLWRRYLIGHPRFIASVAGQWIAKRTRASSER